MRDVILENRRRDSRMTYRGARASRLDNLTDAVFGIAITLLIFNLANPNSFAELLDFTKTLPAFLISIGFLMLVWHEHLRFSEVYGLRSNRLALLNTLFIALVIFYVYPLRFLTLFLSNYFFGTNVDVEIHGDDVVWLLVYYSVVAFALYATLWLFHLTAWSLRDELQLNAYEQFYTRSQMGRMVIMFAVPALCIVVAMTLLPFSKVAAAIVGGFLYNIYIPLNIWWSRCFATEDRKYGLDGELIDETADADADPDAEGTN